MAKTIFFIDESSSALKGVDIPTHHPLVFCTSYKQAMTRLKETHGCSVLISGLSVGGRDGIAFLKKIGKLYPESICMALSNSKKFDVIQSAINEGNIFRYIKKPCESEELTLHISEALRAYEASRKQRRMAQNTLIGSVRSLVDILELVNPEAIGFSQRIRKRVVAIGQKLQVRPKWELELAVMLSHIGCVALPSSLLDKVNKGMELSAEEDQMFSMHPKVASAVIKNIEQMDGVADIVERIHEKVNEDQPMGARIIKVALDVDLMERKGMDALSIVAHLMKAADTYDQAVVACMKKIICPENICAAGEEIPFRKLKKGMVMAEDLVNRDGTKLLLKGQAVSSLSLKRLKGFHKELGLPETLRVEVGVGVPDA